MRTNKILSRRVAATVATGSLLVTGVAVVTPAAVAAVVSAVASASVSNAENNGEQTLPSPPPPARIRPVQQVLAQLTRAGTATVTRTVSPTPTTSATAAAKTTTTAASPTPATSATAAVSTPTTAAKSTAAAVAPTPLATGKGVPGAGTGKTLVLYDTTGPYGWLGEVYGIQAANLSSHFGSWAAAPVANYKAGDMSAYSAVIYVGSTYDEPLPVAFLDDVTAGKTPVTWMYDNIWQLTARDANFVASRGFTYRQFDLATIKTVNYKGKALTRDVLNAGGIMDLSITDATKTTVLADAVRADGTTLPWAVRSGNLTYVGEIPFSYVTGDDRYLAFADLLFDSLAPQATARHRALARIEDVGPDSDPAELRAVADYLYAEKVPFSVAVYSRYRDPKGINNGGKAEDYSLASKPLVVAALKYMQSKGGTLIMHGYTHQYGNVANPYDGVSANDFEFYAAHIDANNNVIYDGPVPTDSAAYAQSRVLGAKADFTRAGLTQPTIWEFPHYAASAIDYRTINSLFTTRYDRGIYFPGVLTGKTIDYTRATGQFFPYSVRDVYGTVVVPENLGNVEPEAFNNHAARLPSDLIASADRNLVVRDGVASFFYHPYLGTTYLKELVTGVKGKGYTFVTAASSVS